MGMLVALPGSFQPTARALCPSHPRMWPGPQWSSLQRPLAGGAPGAGLGGSPDGTAGVPPRGCTRRWKLHLQMGAAPRPQVETTVEASQPARVEGWTEQPRVRVPGAGPRWPLTAGPGSPHHSRVQLPRHPGAAGADVLGLLVLPGSITVSQQCGPAPPCMQGCFWI